MACDSTLCSPWSRVVLPLLSSTLSLLLTAGMARPVAAESIVVMHGFCFRSPLPLSAPQLSGTDALVVMHPAGAQPGGELFSLTAVRFPLEVTDTKAGMTPAELRAYVRSTFLAAAPLGGEPMRRRLLGRWVEGESFTTSIPAPSLGEVVVLRRRDGDSVVFGFKVRRDWADRGRELITAISASLREGQESCIPAAGTQGAEQRTRRVAPATPTTSRLSRSPVSSSCRCPMWSQVLPSPENSLMKPIEWRPWPTTASTGPLLS